MHRPFTRQPRCIIEQGSPGAGAGAYTSKGINWVRTGLWVLTVGSMGSADLECAGLITLCVEALGPGGMKPRMLLEN